MARSSTARQSLFASTLLCLATIGCAGNGSKAATQNMAVTHQIVLLPPAKAELNAPRQSGKGQPLQVGFARLLSAEQRRVPLARLRWSPMKSTGYAAMVSIQSPGAKSLRVSCQLSRNVSGLQIVFRDATKVVAVVQGSAFNTSEPHWSPVIDGDTIWIELRAPAPVQDSTLLELPQVSHMP
jgi:lysyl endopeptidase